jgi:AraC-like DNA-binding protein
MGQGLAQHVTDSLLQPIQLSLLDAAACGLAERQRAAAGPHQGLCAPASARSGPERRCRGRSAQLQQASSYNAFADERLSISQHIWAERVALFQRELLSPANRHCTLTELALASGFASGAHLSRLFKQHTGQTPAQFRAGMFGSSC